MENNKHIIRFLKDNNYFAYFKKGLKGHSKECSQLFLLNAVNREIKEEFESYLIKQNSSDIKILFDEFLIQNHLFGEFYKNAYANGSLTLKICDQTVDIRNYIIDSFIWRQTKQGYSTWYNLSYKWRRISPRILDELLRKETFNKPLFKTNEEYVNFIAKHQQ